ncbi:hypothetical protein M6B38_379510 [Iris pallida]|uniref:Uncharacterized protein n=1 Tax=Iris pallida TaxID=29817 RepID=A0AAX6G8U0_IRIPA|nr:hypothetical protein M6B38_379510 [Iris pallida]
MLPISPCFLRLLDEVFGWPWRISSLAWQAVQAAISW